MTKVGLHINITPSQFNTYRTVTSMCTVKVCKSHLVYHDVQRASQRPKFTIKHTSSLLPFVQASLYIFSQGTVATGD